MNRKIPAGLQDLLRDFIQQINSEKPELLRGVYVYGSVALGAYNPQKSDVDFMALLRRPCTAEDLQILAKVHKTISQKYPKNQLDGSYLQANDIGKLNGDLDPYSYFDGAFHSAGHYDVNLITWWTLKHHGISIYGDNTRCNLC